MRVTCSSVTPPRKQGGSPRKPTISSAGRPSCAAWKRCCAAVGWSRWSARAASVRRGWHGARWSRPRPGTATASSLCPLSALLDPELLPHTVARQLDLPEQSRGSQLDAVLTHLRDQSVLLVLDTCEHIIDACALFAEAVITETREVTVLATSREPLDVTGESCYILPRLGLPGDDTPAQGATDAIELFALRAAAVLPGFTLNDANRTDVIRLCRRLDGMPLAIELAAVRLRALPLAELADRIDQRLDRRLTILTGGGEGGDTRHRTLRDAIGWSYDLCTPAEQALWARLSVFAGSFCVEAAEEVCAGGELSVGQIFDTVVRLVDKSVITRDDASRGAASRRGTRCSTPSASSAPRSWPTRAPRRTSATGSSPATCRWRATSASTWSTTTSSTGSVICSASTPTSGPRSATRWTRPTATATGTAPSSPSRLYGYWHMSGLLREGKYWLDKVLERFPDPSSSGTGLGAGRPRLPRRDAGRGGRGGGGRHRRHQDRRTARRPQAGRPGLLLPDARADDRRPVRGGPRGRRAGRAAAGAAQRPGRAAHPRRAPRARGPALRRLRRRAAVRRAGDPPLRRGRRERRDQGTMGPGLGVRDLRDGHVLGSLPARRRPSPRPARR